MEEIWKDIAGYEGLYQVSNLGNVKSLNYCGRGYERILVPKINNCGRLWVELRKNRKSKYMLVHRMVALAFIENPNNYPQINHIDENPKNNCVGNLEWCTAEYNNRYSRERHPENYKRRLGDHRPRGKYNITKPREKNKPYRHTCRVDQLSKTGNLIKTWDSIISVCNANKWNETSLLGCCNGKRKTAYGYIWRYAN